MNNLFIPFNEVYNIDYVDVWFEIICDYFDNIYLIININYLVCETIKKHR